MVGRCLLEYFCSYNVPFAGKWQAEEEKVKNVIVSEQLAEVEYELARNRMVQENGKG
jgi:hypothetical protein